MSLAPGIFGIAFAVFGRLNGELETVVAGSENGSGKLGDVWAKDGVTEVKLGGGLGDKCQPARVITGRRRSPARFGVSSPLFLAISGWGLNVIRSQSPWPQT